MELYITHVGRMAMKALPLLRMPTKKPSEVSIFLTANKYMHIKVMPNGIIYAEKQLAGYYADYWSLTEAQTHATIHDMKIVGKITYEEY